MNRLGGYPVTRRKDRVKWLWSQNPKLTATSATVCRQLSSMGWERLIRALRTYSIGLMPMVFRNVRTK